MSSREGSQALPIAAVGVARLNNTARAACRPGMEPPMLTVSKDRPLLTTITGSLPRPHWFVANLQGRPFSLAMTDICFREQYTDAVAAYLSDQVRAGLDLLTDGDARCDCDVGGRSWFAYATERLYGLEGHHVGRGRTASSRDKVAGDIMFEVLETRVLPNVRSGVRRGPLEYARVWKVAQRLTRRPVKFGAISGQMVATGVHDEHYGNRRDLIMALSAAMNEELAELAEAGCPVIRWRSPRSTAWSGSTTRRLRASSWSRPSTARCVACVGGRRCGATPVGATRPPSAPKRGGASISTRCPISMNSTSTLSPSKRPTTAATRSRVSPKASEQTRRSPSASSAIALCRWSGLRTWQAWSGGPYSSCLRSGSSSPPTAASAARA